LTYIIPKLMVAQRPIFSAFRISNDRVINHGKAANTKSMMILYTYALLVKVPLAHTLLLLTISTLLKVVAKGPADAKIEPVPILITWLVTDLCPLEDHLQYHVKVHRDNTKPQDSLLPPVAQSQQRHTKCRF
jgi:hypothetical protein